jgi:anti-sigma regulatory factor (Ser/Thr protein kinase)
MRPDLELLLTELVSNVVRHSGLGPEETMDVNVRIEPKHVRVEVRDAGNWVPPSHEHAVQRDVIGGFGLTLVAQLASRWGVIEGGGTTVWFELKEGTDP